MTWTKDPNAILDYQLDWAPWLGNDVIATSTWIPGGGEGDDSLVVDSDSFTYTATKVWLSGGVARNRAYRLTNRITTTGGRTEDRTISVRVADR